MRYEILGKNLVITSPDGRRAIFADNFFIDGLRPHDPWYGLTPQEAIKRLEAPRKEKWSWRDYLWAPNPVAQLGATVYSDGLAKARAARRTKPSDHYGIGAVLSWTFAALPAGNIADVLVGAKLYKGDKVFTGWETHSALSSGGGVATGSVGVHAILADGMSLGALVDVDRFLAATDWDAAGGAVLASTQALFYGYEPTADQFVTITNSVEAFATSGVVKGHLHIVGQAG